MKKILIDLYMLKYPNCGFGQIAWNYARWFRDEYVPSDDLEVTLLVPAKYNGAFGSKVKYQSALVYKKLFPSLFPKYDIWHSTDQMPRFRPYSHNTKYILTVHDFNYEYEKSGVELEHARLRMERRLKRADHIVCISHFTEGEMTRYAKVDGTPITVIYNGVESLLNQNAEPPVNLPSDKPFFFTIGEVRKKKNFHTLLDVMKSFPEYELYIAGTHPTDYASTMQRRIDEEKIENVHLIGRVGGAERVWLYKNCSAFMFPSLFEGFGLPVIEAMQFGKPVFSSDKTSLKEIGSKYAFFWERFDADYMVDVVKKGLAEYKANPSLASEIAAYGNSFTYEKNISALFELYRSLM